MNELNSITGLTIDRLLDRINNTFPNAVLGEDSDGNLIVHLNHYLDGDTVTAFVCPECETESNDTRGDWCKDCDKAAN